MQVSSASFVGYGGLRLCFECYFMAEESIIYCRVGNITLYTADFSVCTVSFMISTSFSQLQNLFYKIAFYTVATKSVFKEQNNLCRVSITS